MPVTNYTRAHSYVTGALAAGRLVPRPCERCGAEPVKAHHDDYARPRDVRWLCQRCHSQWHAENGPGLHRDEHAPRLRHGRPPSDLEVRFQVRLSKEESSLFAEAAAREGLTIAEWLRRAAQEEARRQRER